MKVDELEYLDNTEEAVNAAKDAGMDVIVGDEKTILLDLDSAADVNIWRLAKEKLSAIGYWASKIEEWASKSDNTHVKITLLVPIKEPERRIMLAVMLGSDRTRGLLALTDLEEGREYPDVLFRPAKSKIRVS